ncbi:hypothetical protein GCM10007276_09260 [Agaricicola taiwanensis]|uniref:DUF3750 domain-containing protein n=1 Tax=Agaricicola taiwanensis TaxID=591372 RepID=A0A8J2YFR4_9RHOB|nr:DUF3750 domain-containing protein [Agaricicola taiwanensis]GGE34052.1 hypothetical protein GCM10007276_09260 [Agaricicola taiwanensis]
MLSLFKNVLLFLTLIFFLPLGSHAAWWWNRGWSEHWSGADWSSARLLPPAEDVEGATVHVMAARVGRWRGIFAHHTWIVIKPADASRYTRYDVVGWGAPVRTDHREADARWFGNDPVVLVSLNGEAAEKAIPSIRRAVAGYPFAGSGSYRAWPGPNSNTFIAHVAQAVPALAPALLPTALGKDFRSTGFFAGFAPSGLGIQLSYDGLFGVTVGWVEGLEVNFLGAVAGLDLRRPAIKLPGWGRIGLAPA